MAGRGKAKNLWGGAEPIIVFIMAFLNWKDSRVSALFCPADLTIFAGRGEAGQAIPPFPVGQGVYP